MSFQCYLISGHKKDIINNYKGLESWIGKTIQEADMDRTDDRSVLNPSLRKTYDCLIKTFPPMNGRDAVQDDDLADIAVDYCLTPDMIVIDCGYSKEESVLAEASRNAHKYGLTLCWVDLFSLDSPHKTVATHSIHMHHSFWESFWYGFKNGALLFAICFFLLLPLLFLKNATTSLYLWMAFGLSFSLGVCLFFLEYKRYRRGYGLSYETDVTSVTVTVNGVEKEYSSIDEAFKEIIASSSD